MDGITAAKALKALMPTLPIIMLSNFAEDEFLKQEVVSEELGRSYRNQIRKRSFIQLRKCSELDLAFFSNIPLETGGFLSRRIFKDYLIDRDRAS